MFRLGFRGEACNCDGQGKGLGVCYVFMSFLPTTEKQSQTAELLSQAVK